MCVLESFVKITFCLFGVQYYIYTKLRLHNITSKASLCYGSETCTINKRDAQMRFLRPLLGLTRLDHQRNLEIRNNLKVDNIVEDIKQYQRRLVDHLE
jgi:hypothetical protein